MHNNTPDDYKEAVRNKYEKEKDGIYSNYLSNPSQASLRDLCWEIFKSNKNTDDLLVYKKFFKCEFDTNNEDTSIVYTNKFKKVGGFFRRGIEPAKIDTVNFAAILVGFELRPYTKFKLKAGSEGEIEVEEVVTKILDDLISSSLETEIKLEEKSVVENESSKEVETLIEDEYLKEEEIRKEALKPVNFSPNSKKKLFEKSPVITNQIVLKAIGIIVVLSSVYFYFTQKKQCMQWSKDHYEAVSCDIVSNKMSLVSPIVTKKEENIISNFKKIKVCDTTSFFKLGKPCVWYGKSFDGSYDCFTAPGLHPETGKTLKPITEYIVKKHLLKNKEE